MGLRSGCAALSGTHAPHLQRRNGIFHLRLRVPEELRLRIGLCEVKRSLRTYSDSKARLLAAIYVPRVRGAFEMLRAKEFSREHAHQIVREVFYDLKDEVNGGFLPRSSRPDLETNEQAELARECIRDLEDGIASRDFPKHLLVSANAICAAQGWSFDSLADGRRHDLLEGLARAVIEQQRVFLFRLRDRLSAYATNDPLFACAINCTPGLPRPHTSPSTVDLGPPLREAIETYLSQGKKKWTGKTHAGRVRQLRYVEEHFGPERELSTITGHDVRSYRDAIRRLRSNHHRTSARTFVQRQTENEKHRISAKTATLMFETVKAFFRWATEAEGFISVNPAENVRIESPKKTKGLKARRPFTDAELTTLFSQPIFTGCASAKRRFLVGSTLIRDDYFWIPILGFYTGARLGEIVQLHLGDIALSGQMPFIEITEAGGDQPNAPNAKHVKSAAGIRQVPLHPDVLQLGFADFVSSRRKNRKSTERLFHRIQFGSDGQASTVFSKWFARFLDKAGLTDRAVVFHSFRHNAEDAFRNALQPQYVIDRIIGHSDGSTSAMYGQGVSLQTKCEAIHKMELLIRVPNILGMNVIEQEGEL